MTIQGLLKSRGFRWLGLVLGSLIIMCVVGLALTSMKMASPASRLEASFDQESWRLGYCPNCGNQPDFAYLREDGGRWLRCGHCDTQWLFQRIECPYCGNNDQERLGYILAENDGFDGCRIYLCEKCDCYIGAIDTREVGPINLWTLEHVRISRLEKEAEAMGYKLGWKFAY